MYITKVELTDLRCFEKAVIDLTDHEPGTSVLIAGNNGTGKSSILRAIAMGLCDRDSAASLLRELEGNTIRERAAEKGERGEKTATISIELVDEHGNPWKIVTTITEWKKLIIERVNQTYDGGTAEDENDFDGFALFWDDLFVSGYGAGLRTTATAKFSDYFAPDSVYSLFKYDSPLQDPEMAWRRLRAAAEKDNETNTTPEQIDLIIKGLLEHVLDLEHATVNLHPNGIFIKDSGDDIPLDALGDGYKSLIKISLDILVWYLLKINFDKENKGEDRDWKLIPLDKKDVPIIPGIVIIDEIEQHLHPKLQRQIIKRLNEKFPYIQFIVTTHSPLCVSGTADVQVNGSAAYKVFSLCRKDDGLLLEPRDIPHGLRADQILVDYFELPTTLNIQLADKVDQYRDLVKKELEGNKLTSEEQALYHELKSAIAATAPLIAERQEDREIELKMMKTTKKT